MHRATTRTVALLLAAALAAGACSSDASPEPPLVVTTTGLLADVVGAVGSEAVEVVSLLPDGGDPERDAGVALGDLPGRPSLIVSVGLGFEQGMRSTLDEALASGIPVVEVAPFGEPIEGDDGRPDPRIWLDPLRIASIAPVIARWMSGVVPELGTPAWQGRGRALADEMRALHDLLSRELDGLLSFSAASPGLGYIEERFGIRQVEPPGSPAIVDGTDRDLPQLPPGVEPLPVPLDDLGDASGYEGFLTRIAAALRTMEG